MIFEWLYAKGRDLDRALTRPQRLPAPVLSVGNIASGGRAKTPMVIELCGRLRKAGRAPVVLTRGYGRREHEARVVYASGRWPSPEEAGDEALEIALLAEVPVLVGPRRAANAQAYLPALDEDTRARTVFVLDDGFQHWALARDVDVVLVAPEDHRDRLLPRGRLRERPEALRRAHCVLELGTDVHKRSVLPLIPPAGGLTVLSTRAPDLSYREEVARLLPGRELQFLDLADHASPAHCRQALARVRHPQILLGIKEAVKLLQGDELRRFLKGEAVTLGALRCYPVLCRLEWSSAAERQISQQLERLR